MTNQTGIFFPGTVFFAVACYEAYPNNRVDAGLRGSIR